MKGHVIYQGEIIRKYPKYNDKITIVISRTIGPVLIKLSTKHLWVKVAQVLAHLSWRLKWVFLITICFLLLSLLSLTFHIFFFFSRTTVQISAKLGTKCPWLKGIQASSYEESCSFPRGDKKKKSENILTKFKDSFLQNHLANFNQTWHKASFGKGDSTFWKWRATPFFKGRK